MIYYVDGQYTNRNEVTVSIDDRGYYFGDGIYEVIKVYNGNLFTGEEHTARLFESAAKIKLDLPYTEKQILDIAQELIKSNNIVDGHIYMQVTRGAAVRQHHFPTPAVAPVLTAYAVTAGRPVKQMEVGVNVKSVDDIRWLRCDIKSLNLLGSVLAKEEAHAGGYFEAILHRDGVVTEGSSTNMFGIKDGVVYTHPVTNLILNGITRQVVLSLCKELNIPVEEKAFSLEEAFDMDEFFLTSTTSEVMPVVSIDDRVIGNGKRGLVTEKLQQAFATRIPFSVTDIS